MKTLLLLLALAVSVSAQTFKDGENITNWALMLEAPTAKIYFAPDSIRRSDDFTKVWLRVDFLSPSDGVGSIRGYGLLNCANLSATSKSVLVLYYDRDGRLTKRAKETETVKGNNGANALTAIFGYFCENVDTSPPSGPPVLKSKPNP